jgi:hypothetical protein
MDSLLRELKETILAAVEGISPEQMRWHPTGKWCAAEILEHLYLTYTGTIKGFERALEAGKPSTTNATLAQRWGTLVVLSFNYLPEGRKAPKGTVPKGLPAEQVKAEVQMKISEMEQIIAKCEKQFGRGKLLDHPVLGPLTAAQWRKFHLVHGLHHVKQILGLRRQLRELPEAYTRAR